MDISSDIQTKSHIRKLRHGKEKGNIKRETKSLLKAVQNNALRTNCDNARIDKPQQNSRCRQCDGRDETINRIISECSKSAQKEKKY